MRHELQIGEAAPHFEALLVGGDGGVQPAPFRLQEARGSRLVLCFYPLDDVPGCVAEVCGLRDDWPALAGRARIVCLSSDTPEGLQRLAEHYALPFALASDPGDKIAKAYGLWLGDGGGGDVEGGSPTERATFIVGAEGMIEGVLRDPAPDEHARRLRVALEAL